MDVSLYLHIHLRHKGDNYSATLLRNILFVPLLVLTFLFIRLVFFFFTGKNEWVLMGAIS